jgi:hypothetical protein
MFVAGLSDLDALVLRCRDAKARSYIAEAVTCLKAGAFRASIVVTWVAIVHDLLAKLEQLVLAGDKNAQTKVDQFRQIVSTGDVKASLEFERTILDVARDEFELFGSLAHVDLVRLRDDRHRCAHPSMLDPDTDYQPVPELARCHMVNAVTHLLQHGPAQGKAAMDRLLGELEQNYFPKNVDELVVHLEHGPLGRPRASLVRNFVIVLLKQYFAEPPAPPQELLESMRVRRQNKETARRIVQTLEAIVRMHRELAIGVLNEKLDGLVAQAIDARLGAFLVLAANIADAWHALSKAQRNRGGRYVRAMPVADFEGALSAAWSIAEVQPEARARIVDSDSWGPLAKVVDPPVEWVQLALDKMSNALTWGEANPPRVFLEQFAHLISEEQARALLRTAIQNKELQSSWGVKDTLGALSRSPHMGPERVKTLVEEAGLADTYSGEHWWPKAAESAYET